MLFWSIMSERFLKFIPSEAAIQFAIKYKNAFILLMIIANQARRKNGNLDGLTIGQCHLGGHKNYGMTDKEYRYAKKVLVEQGLIKIVVTSRTRKKAKQTKKLFETTNGANERANEPTTEGTLVELCNSEVWDINSESDNHSKGERKGESRANQGRIKGDKQEGLRRIKNDQEKEDHPSIPSGRDDALTDDFLSKGKREIIPGVFLSQEELEACIRIKGDEQKVIQAIVFIQKSPKRKKEILDWPNALSQWKIPEDTKARLEDNFAFAKKLCMTFCDFKKANGWKCSMYRNKKKDQTGILFESQSPYQESIFIPFSDGEFEKKCEENISKNSMRIA